MLAAGPLSNLIGRRSVLYWAAVLYAISAIGSALAPSYLILVIARMVGGLGGWCIAHYRPDVHCRNLSAPTSGDGWYRSINSIS